ncbi:MAG: TIGR04211 family SH3 domain-containing protein [Mariprofundaceae bacterium]
MKTFLAFVIFIGVVTVAQAETMYIEDQLKLPMRKGQSTGHGIVRMLPSGLKVETLEQNKDTGYTRIRTSAGTEGWVLSRYLMKKPAARLQLVKAEKKLARLEAEKNKLDTRLNILAKEKGTLDQEHALLLRKNSELGQELKEIRLTSANAVAISDENKALKNQLATVGQELQSFRQEVGDLKSGIAQKWFMIGGGAVLLGIFLGLFLPNLRTRRQSRWGRY